jgi:hypothetical protein
MLAEYDAGGEANNEEDERDGLQGGVDVADFLGVGEVESESAEREEDEEDEGHDEAVRAADHICIVAG